MKEIWKDVVGYEGYYQVSNYGNVRSVDRILPNRTCKGKLLKQVKDKDGYLMSHLSKDGKATYFRTHRLVATAFIKNIDKLPEVNHKDEDKENNRVDNLEWCTTKHNINHGTRNKRVSLSLSGEKAYCHKLSKNQVSEIRKSLGKHTVTELAKIYGVSRSQIWKIVNYKQWKQEETP